MKRTHLFIGFSLMLAAACSKSDKGTSPPESLSTTISTQIAKTDSLSSFNKYFKAGTLSDADISGGITVFAPSNNAFGNASVTGTGQLPDSSVLKDYIVKGILKGSDLTKGKTLTTLSGKTLTVSVVADPIILVGGMIINSNVIASSDNYVVYGAAQLLNAPAPVFITVWDATKWSSSKPKGELAAAATVRLYTSQESFVLNINAPAYTGTTDADGVAQINGVKPGTYYVQAYKGPLQNIFINYSQAYNNVWLGYAADTVLDNAGNFIWKDLNQDGKVDTHDQTGQPALSIQAEKNKPVDISVIIGHPKKPLTSVAQLQTELDGIYAGLSTLYKNLVIMDGTLSDDAACGSDISYCPLDNFTMTPATTVLNSIWNDAYFKGIYKLNGFIYDVITFEGPITDEQKSDFTQQAKVFQGYLYLELLTYFGDVPYNNTDATPDFWPGVSRTAASDVYYNIMFDLTSPLDNALPVTRATGKDAITRYAALALAARGALQQKKYNDVLTYTAQIINSGAFALAPAGYSWLTSQNTSETIWAPGFSNIGTSAAWYYDGAFGGTQLQWCPVLRYADVLLMDAEAKIATANFNGAAQDINLLKIRNSQGTVSFNNSSDGMAALQETWQGEKLRQGDRYACLLRWGNAQNVLGAAGWHPWNTVMPIPQAFINTYPNLVQNPGY